MRSGVHTILGNGRWRWPTTGESGSFWEEWDPATLGGAAAGRSRRGMHHVVHFRREERLSKAGRGAKETCIVSGVLSS